MPFTTRHDAQSWRTGDGTDQKQHSRFRLEGTSTSRSKAWTAKPTHLPTCPGPKGTLVVFICNHCPYVKASIGRIVAEATALREIGIGTIAVMPNDTEAYRED